MKIKNRSELPEITQRILELIDGKFDGNVLQFSLALGLSNSSKINRLFLKDKRNNNYPMPSTDIVILISNAFDVSADWLLKGVDVKNQNKHVNTINIGSTKINGNKNITNSHDVKTSDSDGLITTIKEQQEQINKLLNIILKQNG